MEESDNQSQQPKRCPCGFWGSPQTSGLCSKCYKAVVQEKTPDALDAKAELMRERQSAYTSRESLGASSSSYLATSCAQSSASDVEKAGELLRQAVRNNANSNQSVSELNNNSNTTSNSDSTETSTSTTTAAAATATGNNSTEDCEKSMSSSSVSSTSIKTESPVASGGAELCVGESSSSSSSKADSGVDSQASSSSSSDQQKKEEEAAAPDTGSCPSTPDKRGLKRDSSALEDADTPDSTPEKPGTKSKKRCAVCKCKLELAQRTIGRCRCDNVYCSLHRLPELHQCDFDHKGDGRREAREKMVKPTRHLGTSFKRLGSDS